MNGYIECKKCGKPVIVMARLHEHWPDCSYVREKIVGTEWSMRSCLANRLTVVSIEAMHAMVRVCSDGPEELSIADLFNHFMPSVKMKCAISIVPDMVQYPKSIDDALDAFDASLNNAKGRAVHDMAAGDGSFLTFAPGGVSLHIVAPAGGGGRGPWTPTELRQRNIEVVTEASQNAPNKVRQFGLRKGPTFERYQRELCALVERCNTRQDPVAVTQSMLATVLEETLGQ